MTNSEMKKQVIEMFLENVPELEGIEIANDTMLISSGYVDSFSVIKMIALFEDAFSVTIDLDEINYEDFETVDSIVDNVDFEGGVRMMRMRPLSETLVADCSAFLFGHRAGAALLPPCCKLLDDAVAKACQRDAVYLAYEGQRLVGVLWYVEEGSFYTYPYLHMIVVDESCEARATDGRCWPTWRSVCWRSG